MALEDRKIIPGDVVTMKGGTRPVMRVVAIEEGYVLCSWMDDRGKIQSDKLLVEVVQIMKYD